MLLIVANSKPDKLHPFLLPLVHGPAKVITTDEIAAQDPPKAMLFMGAKPFALLKEAGLFNKKATVGGMREKVFKYFDFPFLVTFDINATTFMPELTEQIRWDVRLALRLAATGTIDPPGLGHYEYVEDFSQLFEWLNQQQTTQHPIALDLETLGLDEFHPNARVLTIQLSYKLGHSLVYKVPSTGKLPELVLEQLRELFENPYVNIIGANLKYDLRWLYKHFGLEVRNHKFDSQLVGGLLDENRHNSLKSHVKEYAPDLGGYETAFEAAHDKSQMDKALCLDPSGFLQYAGGDTDGLFRIYQPLKKALCKDPELARFYTRLLHPASIAFRKMESRGIVIDQERYAVLQTQAETELAQLHKTAFAMMPNKIKYKYYDNLKLSRPAIIRDFLFSPTGLNLKPLMMTDSGEGISTAWEHLKEFQHHKIAGPFVKVLKEYYATKKTLDTYIIGFLKHLRSDGYFHPSYVLAKGGQAGDEDVEGGTNTGRSSCKDPAYQTWPKRTAWAKRLRSVVICPKGYVIVKFDFSQGELRIMADAANCKAMIEAYLKGYDLHALTAAGFLNMTMEQFLKLPEDEIEKHRYGAKAGNFGLIYRISFEGYQAFAEYSYGVILTLQQAQKNHAQFFKTYPEIHSYHESQVAYAKQNLFVRNQLGRVRHLPLINSFDNQLRGKQERQAINAPTQGCLFDLMMLAMIQIDKYMPDVWMFGNTHDSLEMYLKEDTWEEQAKQIKGLVEDLPLQQFGWAPKVSFKVDFEMSATNLGEMKKVKLIA